MTDAYYTRSEVSNSDLSAMRLELTDSAFLPDLQQAYKEGSLIDALITEPEKPDHFLKQLGEVQYTDEEWEMGMKCHASYMKDPVSASLQAASQGQAVATKRMQFNVDGIEFEMPMRCKYDLYAKHINLAGDVKSTKSTSLKGFRNAAIRFDYPRQGALYMDIGEIDKFVIIGVSKVNYRLFKLYMERGDELYQIGKRSYEVLALRYYLTVYTIAHES